MKYYPIFVVAEEKPCAVVGEGEEATQKVRGLLDAGALVSVIAPTQRPLSCAPWRRPELSPTCRGPTTRGSSMASR